MSRTLVSAVSLLSGVFLAACASQQVVPEELQGRIDRQVSFADLQRAPGEHREKLIILGGEVLSTTRQADRTRLEILQLPLDQDLAPTRDRKSSQGVFLAWNRLAADPIALDGSSVTLVAEIGEPTVLPGDSRIYPTVEVKSLTVWDQSEPPRTFYVYDPFYRAQWGFRPTVKGTAQ